MKVLIIGGAGYIGSHVVKEMMKAGHKVTVFDNLSSGLRCNLFPENDFIYGNILIPQDLEKAFEKGFDAFVHLAAFKAAGESMIEPEKYSVNNITGTINIMNAAVKYGCKKMIFSSSAAVLEHRNIFLLMKSIQKIQKTTTVLQSLKLNALWPGTTSLRECVLQHCVILMQLVTTLMDRFAGLNRILQIFCLV